MSYASLARPGEGHGLIADQQVGSCRVAGLVHSQDQSVGTRISECVTGKRKCVVTVLYFCFFHEPLAG